MGISTISVISGGYDYSILHQYLVPDEVVASLFPLSSWGGGGIQSSVYRVNFSRVLESFIYHICGIFLLCAAYVHSGWFLMRSGSFGSFAPLQRETQAKILIVQNFNFQNVVK